MLSWRKCFGVPIYLKPHKIVLHNHARDYAQVYDRETWHTSNYCWDAIPLIFCSYKEEGSTQLHGKCSHLSKCCGDNRWVIQLKWHRPRYVQCWCKFPKDHVSQNLGTIIVVFVGVLHKAEPIHITYKWFSICPGNKVNITINILYIQHTTFTYIIYISLYQKIYVTLQTCTLIPKPPMMAPSSLYGSSVQGKI